MLIGIAGIKYAGKDTAADAMFGFERFKCAGTLKEMTRTFLRGQGLGNELIERLVEGDMKEVEVSYFGKLKTCREFQQKLGTEFGRDILGTNIWIGNELSMAKHVDHVVFTDVRFDNECEAIKAAGGTVIRITSNRAAAAINEHAAHASEQDIDNLDVDFEIANNGTIEELHSAITCAINEIQITKGLE